MARGRADHSVWRELIAARLDRPLSRSETRALAAHLRDCIA
ncbi:MAG: zf-HC2 domain-containing protein, partial [Gemmatimonadaceae bacterium]